MEVTVKKIEPNAILPSMGTVHSAGMDLYSLDDHTVLAFGATQIRTGIAIGWSDPLAYLQLHSRSGLFINHGISCEGGVIDYDYLQEIVVLIQNHSPVDYYVKRGDRICQGVFLLQPMISRFAVTDDFLNQGKTYFPTIMNVQRDGGLGSTGK
jgi:dUTP pyrophosphatase